MENATGVNCRLFEVAINILLWLSLALQAWYNVLLQALRCKNLLVIRAFWVVDKVATACFRLLVLNFFHVSRGSKILQAVGYRVLAVGMYSSAVALACRQNSKLCGVFAW